MNVRGAPEWIRTAHLADELAQLGRHPRSAHRIATSS
jgi:hypothetical protein